MSEHFEMSRLSRLSSKAYPRFFNPIKDEQTVL